MGREQNVWHVQLRVSSGENVRLKFRVEGERRGRHSGGEMDLKASDPFAALVVQLATADPGQRPRTLVVDGLDELGAAGRSAECHVRPAVHCQKKRAT